jgi:hypothetical protein
VLPRPSHYVATPHRRLPRIACAPGSLFILKVCARPGVRATAGLLVALVLLGAGCYGTAPAATAPVTIAPLHGNTAVEAYGGVEAWSDYEVADRSWHVVVRRDGQISTPSIPSASKAIAVTVGPGPSGSPVLAYLSCARRCHLVVSAVNGSDPRSVPGTEGASHPTIWGDRVAWVSGATKVMTSLWNGAGRRVLPGAPRRKCYESPAIQSRLVCEAPKEPSVDALALDGRRLALIDTFTLNDGIGSVGTTTEVRMEAVTGGPQRLVALLDVGEGNETWLGPSWFGGELYFYEDTDGTTEGAVDGFNPVHDTYVSTPANAYLTGFSMTNSRQAYEATAPGNPRAGYVCAQAQTSPCVIRVSAPFAFKPSRSLVHSP